MGTSHPLIRKRIGGTDTAPDDNSEYLVWCGDGWFGENAKYTERVKIDRAVEALSTPRKQEV